MSRLKIAAKHRKGTLSAATDYAVMPMKKTLRAPDFRRMGRQEKSTLYHPCSADDSSALSELLNADRRRKLRTGNRPLHPRGLEANALLAPLRRLSADDRLSLPERAHAGVVLPHRRYANCITQQGKSQSF